VDSLTDNQVMPQVNVNLDRVTPDKPMSFSTLNEDIDVTLPPDTKATVKMDGKRAPLACLARRLAAHQRRFHRVMRILSSSATPVLSASRRVLPHGQHAGRVRSPENSDRRWLKQILRVRCPLGWFGRKCTK